MEDILVLESLGPTHPSRGPPLFVVVIDVRFEDLTQQTNQLSIESNGKQKQITTDSHRRPSVSLSSLVCGQRFKSVDKYIVFIVCHLLRHKQNTKLLIDLINRLIV